MEDLSIDEVTGKPAAARLFGRIVSFGAGKGLTKKWVQIAPLGLTNAVDGRTLLIEKEDAEAVVSELESRGNDIPVIFEHGEGPDGGEAKGWLKKFELRATGIWGLVEWFADVAEKIREGRWKYQSPSFLFVKDKAGNIRPRKLVELTVTNIPAIPGMIPIEASIKTSFDTAWADVLVEPSPQYVLSDIRRILNLPVAATVDEIIASITRLAGVGQAQMSVTVQSGSDKEQSMDKETLALLGLPETATPQEIEVAIKAKMSAQKTELDVRSEIQSLFQVELKRNADAIREQFETERRKDRVDRAIATAKTEGRLDPAKEATYRGFAEKLPPEQFEALLAELPTPTGRKSVIEKSMGQVVGDVSRFHGYVNEKEYCQAIADATVAFGCSVSQAIQLVNAGALAEKEN